MHYASRVRACRAIAAAASVLVLAAAALTAQRQTAVIPPLSHTCPHHPDVIESAPGTCPICKMALVPARLGQAWSCPVHPATVGAEPGACPICRRQLVRVTVSVVWTCTGSPTEFLEPGLCLDGSTRTRAQRLRPHGDHNPRYGGQFFMAPDNWHHVEGTYPAPGLFRFYVYDDYGRPLSDERLRRVAARVVTRERFDPATRRTVEETAFPLRLARGGGHLEARIEAAPLPAEMIAKVKLAPDGDEYRFDFTFTTLSAPATAAPSATAASPTSPAAPARPAAAPRETAEAAPAAPAGAAAGFPEPAPELAVRPIPDTVSAIVEQLRERRGHVASLIERGDFTAVWVPAFAARDLAIALEPHLEHLAGEARTDAALAIQRTVRLAWLLDAHGDGGNREAVEAAFDAFGQAVDRVAAAFEHVHQ